MTPIRLCTVISKSRGSISIRVGYLHSATLAQYGKQAIKALRELPAVGRAGMVTSLGEHRIAYVYTLTIDSGTRAVLLPTTKKATTGSAKP